MDTVGKLWSRDARGAELAGVRAEERWNMISCQGLPEMRQQGDNAKLRGYGEKKLYIKVK